MPRGRLDNGDINVVSLRIFSDSDIGIACAGIAWLQCDASIGGCLVKELHQETADLRTSVGSLSAVEGAVGRVMRVDMEVYPILRTTTAYSSPSNPLAEWR